MCVGVCVCVNVVCVCVVCVVCACVRACVRQLKNNFVLNSVKEFYGSEIMKQSGGKVP